jgi:hypothetical protein
MGKTKRSGQKEGQNLNCKKWKKINSSHEQEERATALLTK